MGTFKFRGLLKNEGILRLLLSSEQMGLFGVGNCWGVVGVKFAVS